MREGMRSATRLQPERRQNIVYKRIADCHNADNRFFSHSLAMVAYDRKDKTSFTKWIGLKKPAVTHKKNFVIAIIVTLAVTAAMSPILDPMFPDDVQLANARFAGQGIKAFIPVIIFAFFATALPEELFFRGFLGRRLINKLGFYIGNTIQAVLFGLLHGATLFPALGIATPLLVIAFTAALGWLMGYVSEKADGSILPNWCLHGIANLYAGIIIMFELL
ncbi:MAG: CPBP family intramembrane metalloprotease [Firmicutes bacterium]|nr:CPBP family intramembrane metalloprotease [Bacillota bacterium]